MMRYNAEAMDIDSAIRPPHMDVSPEGTNRPLERKDVEKIKPQKIKGGNEQ